MKKEIFKQDIINYRDGVRRFSDNERLYEKYLLKFITDGHMENAQKAYIEKDYQKLLEQIHPLKGVAGTLGMQALYLACDETVKLLRQNQWEMLDGCMQTIEEEYSLVIELLQQAFEK